MQTDVDAAIAGLRNAVKAKNDAELARLIGVDQSTISSWRSRGRIPQRFMSMFPAEAGAVSSPPQVWGELQERANSVALLRFTILRAELASSKDIDAALAAFLDLKPFWLILHRAVHELRLRMETLNVDLPTAQALLMQADLRDPEGSAQRVADQLREDVADSPWLSSWPPVR